MSTTSRPSLPEQPTVLDLDATADDGRQTLGPGQRVGPYRIERLLGEGGMGAVYLAEQIEPIQREVALKLIRAQLRSGLAEVANFCETIRTLLEDVSRWSDEEIAALRELTAALGRVIVQTQIDLLTEGWSRKACEVESVERIEAALESFFFNLGKQRGHEVETFVRRGQSCATGTR